MNKNIKAVWCPDNTFYFEDIEYGIDELGVITFYGRTTSLSYEEQQRLADDILKMIQERVEVLLEVAP